MHFLTINSYIRILWCRLLAWNLASLNIPDIQSHDTVILVDRPDLPLDLCAAMCHASNGQQQEGQEKGGTWWPPSMVDGAFYLWEDFSSMIRIAVN